jgi:hypothetical protein
MLKNRLAYYSEPFAVILRADFMVFRLTTVHEDARSALECGSEAERSCRLALGKNKAAAGATALQGASRIFMAAKDLALPAQDDSEGLGMTTFIKVFQHPARTGESR